MGRERVYPSDLTDEQWEIIEPMLPLIKEPGRIPKHPFRDIVDAILYIDRSGCSWRQLPVDFLSVTWNHTLQVPSRILRRLHGLRRRVGQPGGVGGEVAGPRPA